MNDYNFLIKETKKVAFRSFEVFLKRIDLDISLFNHLNDIAVKIGEPNSEGAYAEYYPENNSMIISKYKVNSGLRKVRNGEITIDVLIDNIAISYLHELIHANRTIIIANELNLYNYDEVIYKANYNKLYEEKLLKYRASLDIVLEKYDVNKFDKYIPIIVSFNKSGTYNVVAYNSDNKSFEIFNDQKFNSTIKNSRDNFLYDIGNELNKGHTISEEIYDYFDFEDSISLPCDYRFDKNIYYEFRNPKHYNNLKKNIKQQISLDEIITEALAIIMVLTKEDEVIDYEMVLDSDNLDENDVLGIKLVSEFDVETLRWYFLSSYDDVYYDKFSKIFEDKYKDLLKIMYKIYELERPITDEIMNEFKYIVKTKLSNKKK